MITDYWLGLHENSTTSVRIVCRSDSNDQITLVLNGTQNITPDTSVQDGLIKFDVTGLSANNSYSFTLTQLGVVTNGTAKTSRSTGSKALLASCMGIKKPFIHADYFADQDFDFMAIIGDQIYASQPLKGDDTGVPVPRTWNGELMVSPEYLEDALGHTPSPAEYREEYHKHYKAYQRAQGTKQITQKIPYVQSTDDHTWAGNDQACNAGRVFGTAGGHGGMNYHNTNWMTSAAQVEEQWKVGIDVHLAEAMGNPVGVTMGQQSPLGVPNTGGEKIPTEWVIGDIHYIMPEFMVERDAPNPDTAFLEPLTGYTDTTRTRDGQDNDTEGVWPNGKHIWSDDQKNDVFDTIANSTSKYKCLLFSKSTIGRQDSFFDYEQDRDELLLFLFNGAEPGSSWTVPGGAFVIAGDVHEPEVWYKADQNHLQLCCAPSSNNITVNITNLRDDERWRADAPQTQGSGFESAVTVESDGDILHLKMYDTALNVRWAGDIHAGSNELQATVVPTLTRVSEVDNVTITIGLDPLIATGPSAAAFVDDTALQANTSTKPNIGEIPDDGETYEIYEIGARVRTAQSTAAGGPVGDIEIGIYNTDASVPQSLLLSETPPMTGDRTTGFVDETVTLSTPIEIPVGFYTVASIPQANATANVEYGNDFANVASQPLSRDVQPSTAALPETWEDQFETNGISLVLWARARIKVTAINALTRNNILQSIITKLTP